MAATVVVGGDGGGQGVGGDGGNDGSVLVAFAIDVVLAVGRFMPFSTMNCMPYDSMSLFLPHWEKH